MKATGIVRRIDDLGRVVIPKEIRRTMRIREGDPLEIYTDSEGEVIFKKYSPVGELSSFAMQYAEALHKTCGYSIVISDRDCIIACAGVTKRDFLEKKISAELSGVIEGRRLYTCEGGARCAILNDSEKYYGRVIMPIMAEGDIVGSVALISPADEYKAPDESDIKTVQTAALFLGKQIEG